VIASFRDKETELLWQAGKNRHLPSSLQRRAFKKLAILNAAVTLENLKVPPGSQLEKLGGSRAAQHSIRINDQFRVCFVWRSGKAFEVEVVDYH
jgi:proteic killer suppression protein